MDKILIIVIESEIKCKLLTSGDVLEITGDDINEKLSPYIKKSKEIHIFISDLYVFSVTDIFQVKKKSDALKAAEYQLTTVLHSNKIKDYFYSIHVVKDSDKYISISYYTETKFDKIILPIEENFSKKIIRISPLFELFLEKLSAYEYDDYVTLIKNKRNNTFPTDKLPSDLISGDIEKLTTKDVLKYFNKKSEINFKDNNLFINIEKFFYPLLILIVLVNIIIFFYARTSLNSAEKIYKEELSKVKKMEVQLKPFRDLAAKKEEYLSYIELSKKIQSGKNYIEKTIYDLAKDFPNIWVKSLYYRNGKMNISISYEKVQKIVDYLESKKYIASATIKGRVTRRGETENCTIEVTFASR